MPARLGSVQLADQGQSSPFIPVRSKNRQSLAPAE